MTFARATQAAPAATKQAARPAAAGARLAIAPGLTLAPSYGRLGACACGGGCPGWRSGSNNGKTQPLARPPGVTDANLRAAPRVARPPVRSSASAAQPTGRPAYRPSQLSVAKPSLQRRCACGGSCSACTLDEETIQTKLRVGTPGGPLEHEADRTANHVMGSGPRPATTPARTSPLAAPAAPLAAGELTQGGVPLGAALRTFYEARFGRDLSEVRLHTGARCRSHNPRRGDPGGGIRRHRNPAGEHRPHDGRAVHQRLVCLRCRRQGGGAAARWLRRRVCPRRRGAARGDDRLQSAAAGGRGRVMSPPAPQGRIP